LEILERLESDILPPTPQVGCNTTVKTESNNCDAKD